MTPHSCSNQGRSECGERTRTRKRLRARAGVQGLRFHDLRHEAISRFFEAGLSVPEVALLSGHRNARMLMRYTHLRPEVIAEKLARVAEVNSG